MARDSVNTDWVRLSDVKTLPMPKSAELLHGRLLGLDRADPEGVNHNTAVAIYVLFVFAIVFVPLLILSRSAGFSLLAMLFFVPVFWVIFMLVIRPSYFIMNMSKGWLDTIREDIDLLLAPYLVENERILAVLNAADPKKGPWNMGYCIATTHRAIMLKPRTFLHPFDMAKLIPKNYDVQVADIAHPDHFKPGAPLETPRMAKHTTGVVFRPVGKKQGKTFALGPKDGNNFSVFVEITEIRKEIYGSVLNLDY